MIICKLEGDRIVDVIDSDKPKKGYVKVIETSTLDNKVTNGYTVMLVNDVPTQSWGYTEE